MNRILFEPDELSGKAVTFGGVRAEHVLKVLHGEVGQTLKTGAVDGLIGTGTITAIENGRVTVKVEHNEAASAPWVDLVLAPPRPRVLKRLLPQLAALGVGRIMLVGAKKVEKDFWGATLLKEENYRPLFVDGLMQAGTTALPTLETRRNFRKFVMEELEKEFPTESRLVAHPYGGEEVEKKVEKKVEKLGGGGDGGGDGDERVLLAIGPEGGWTDEEVELLETHGFRRYSLGSRILRTDTATIALLAQFLPRN